MRRNRDLTLGIILLVVVTSSLTFFISGMVFKIWDQLNPNYEIRFDSGTVDVKNIEKFNQVKNLLTRYYYESVDENNLVEGAIAGMAAAMGDPYTVYLTKEQMQMLKEISQKSVEDYVGIGVNVLMDENGLLTVIECFEGSSALEAGVLPGDKITKVNGEDVTGIRDSDLIIGKIKGPEGTGVSVTFFRPSEGIQKEFDLTRKKVQYQINIRSEMLTEDIGYIRIKSFNDVNIDALFNEHLEKLKTAGMKSLVIDLRDNPGGYLDKVVNIADMLLPEGNIVYTQDRYNHKEYENSDANEVKVPMVVLINGNSASASEVLAGALKDYKKAVLVGTTSFGKGIVQSVITLDDGSGIKLTTSRYFTPSGVCIHGVGIEPDIKIDSLEKYRNQPVAVIPQAEDIQLQKAIEMAKLKID